jgi:hypothetical protein
MRTGSKDTSVCGHFRQHREYGVELRVDLWQGRLSGNGHQRGGMGICDRAAIGMFRYGYIVSFFATETRVENSL